MTGLRRPAWPRQHTLPGCGARRTSFCYPPIGACGSGGVRREHLIRFGRAGAFSGSRRAAIVLEDGYFHPVPPRSIWNGTIAFGAIAIPIKVHSATEDKTVHFHEVH